MMKHFPVKTVLGVALGLICTGGFSQNVELEIKRGVKLAEQLNDVGLMEYADFHIEDLIKKYGANSMLKAQQVDNLRAQDKIDEAKLAAEALKNDKAAYTKARAAIGIYYVTHNQFQEAIPLLREFYEYSKENGTLDDIEVQLGWLLTAYQRSNQIDKVQALTDEYRDAKMKNANMPPRQKLLFQAKSALDVVVQMRAAQDAAHAEFEKLLTEKATALIAKEPAKQQVLMNLLNQKKAEDAKFFGFMSRVPGNINDKTYTGGKPREDMNAPRLKVYKEIGKTLGIPEEEMIRMADIGEARQDSIRKTKANLIVKTPAKWSDTEQLYMSPTMFNPLSWVDKIAAAYQKLDEIQWGGQDVLTAKAIAMMCRCSYYLGDWSPLNISYARKQERDELYELCDNAYRQEKLPIEESPASDAKMWLGHLHWGRAQELEKKDPKAALKDYMQAFKYFGKLLKDYPKHADAVDNYPKFIAISNKISELNPKISEKLQAEVAKVPRPVAEKKGEAEVLVDPVSDKAFRETKTRISELLKNIKAKNNKVDEEKEWKEIAASMQKIVDELQPKTFDKYNSEGLPILLYYLLNAYAYGAQYGGFDSLFMIETISELAIYQFPGNEQLSTGILDAGNAYWTKAERILSKCTTTETAKMTPADLALQEAAYEQKDIAMGIYKSFLKMTSANHKFAPQVAIRMAREEFIRANDIGQTKLNKEKDPAARALLKQKWVEGFERSIEHYKYIIGHFSFNVDAIDEAYMRIAEAYTTMERPEDAIATFKAYCENGETPIRVVNSKMSIAVQLNNVAIKLDKDVEKMEEKESAIVPRTPEQPKALEERNKESLAVFKAKALKEANEATLKQEAGLPPVEPKTETPEEKTAREAKDKAAFDADMKLYQDALNACEADKKEKVRLQGEIKVLKEKAKETYREAIANIDEFEKWISPGGKFESLLKEQDENIQKQIQANKMRAMSLRPWLYDGCGDKENAIRTFKFYAETFMNDEKHRNDPEIPQYLMRLGVLYIETNQTDKAQNALNILSQVYPNSPEGKNARFTLVKVLWGKSNYKTALDQLDSILADANAKAALTTNDYNWIAANMISCSDKESRLRAAERGFYASRDVLERFNKMKSDLKKLNPQSPTYVDEYQKIAEEWVGKMKAREFSQTAQAAAEYYTVREEFLLINAARAARVAGKLAEAVDFYTKLEVLDEKNPYGYELGFGRSFCNIKLAEATADAAAKDAFYHKAKDDLINLSRRASMPVKKKEGEEKPKSYIGYYYKAQTQLAAITELQGDKEKAFAQYSILTGVPFSKEMVQCKLENTPEDESRQFTEEYLEEALFRSARLARDLGKVEDLENLKKKYNDFYSNGRYADQVKSF